MKRALKYVVISLIGLVAIIYVSAVTYFYINQQEMVFLASKLPADYKFTFNQKFEEFTIPSFDGTKLNGVLFKAEKSKGLIFYLHGNAGALDTWGDIADNYTQFGYDIFILDYRGFGKSEGAIEDEEQVYKDISIVYKQLIKRYEEKNVIITGYSIGSGLASYLAAENNPQKLILLSPYYNVTELSTERAPFFPDFLKKFAFMTNNFIPKIKAPIYIFHGITDEVIGYNHAVRLSKLLKKDDKFFTLQGQGHSQMNDNLEYLKELQQILK